ncbi:MAG: prepilin-type N-terminal cleavage/methylation domain-containing protein [Thermodesulfobacteriota bacterium]
MKRVDIKREEGFTLIEVLVGIFILSMALIALAGLMSTTIRTGDFGRTTSEAANLAREKLEDIERAAMANFDNVQDTVAGSDPVAGVNPDQVEDYGTIAGFSSFRREVYITDGALPVNSKDVAVKVLWSDTVGSGHSTIFRTTMAR